MNYSDTQALPTFKSARNQLNRYNVMKMNEMIMCICFNGAAFVINDRCKKIIYCELEFG